MKEGLLSDVEIRFHHAGGEFTLNRKGLPLQEAYDLCKTIAEKYPDVSSLQEWWGRQNTIDNFGYMGMGKGGDDGYNFLVSAYFPTEKGTEFHTCPRGAESFGPYADRAKESTWDKIGEDRVCSYCGSLHPEDFEKIVDLCIESNGEKAEVERSTKGYKIYARRKDTVNAGQGGIKFYTQHVFVLEQPGQVEYIKRTEPKIQQAHKIGWDKMMAPRRKYEEEQRAKNAQSN